MSLPNDPNPPAHESEEIRVLRARIAELTAEIEKMQIEWPREYERHHDSIQEQWDRDAAAKDARIAELTAEVARLTATAVGP